MKNVKNFHQDELCDLDRYRISIMERLFQQCFRFARSGEFTNTNSRCKRPFFVQQMKQSQTSKLFKIKKTTFARFLSLSSQNKFECELCLIFNRVMRPLSLLHPFFSSHRTRSTVLSHLSARQRFLLDSLHNSPCNSAQKLVLLDQPEPRP
jgi:hypothetical protein